MPAMISKVATAIAFLLTTSGSAAQNDTLIAERVRMLMSRMNNDQKAAQLIQGDVGNFLNISDPYSNDRSTVNITGLEFNTNARNAALWVGYNYPIERLTWSIATTMDHSLYNTSLGIPPIPQSEALHGLINRGTTFPSPIGLACSFNRTLLHDIGKVIATEARALGIRQVFAPVLDLARELRWGRVEETFGEDPFLVGELGYNMVTGIQSDSLVAATCKHFAAFGSPLGGLNTAPVAGGIRDLRSYYLPPFHRACVQGQAMSLMSAYSSYDGVPAAANTDLLTNILRSEWNWEGYVTDDAGGTSLLCTSHGLCRTGDNAAAATYSINAGNDAEMGGGNYAFSTLPQLVANGSVSQERLDQAVERVLTVKFKLGLFDDPFPLAYSNETLTEYLKTPQHLAVDYEAEIQSIVLLENRNETLPLSKNVSSIAIIGPSATPIQFGDYVLQGAVDDVLSPLDAIRMLVGNSTKINYAQGAEFWSNDESGFGEALSVVEASEVAIVFVGTWTRDQTSLWSPWPGLNATTGEHVDQSSLHLVGAQRRLVGSVIATGKPTVVVLLSGKPISEPEIATGASAIVQQFYPGEQGGRAIAEILFGDANPSGKLSVSFPRSVGTTPAFYNYLKGGRAALAGTVYANGTLEFGKQYVLDSPVPIWPFGHGLSYTEFSYSNFAVDKRQIGTVGNVTVMVNIANSGDRDGAEVVQVYLTDLVSSVVTPNQKLVGFERVKVLKGETVKVSIPIDVSSQFGTLSFRRMDR